MHARSSFFWLTFIVYPRKAFLWKNLFSFCVSIFYRYFIVTVWINKPRRSLDNSFVKVLELKLKSFGILSIFNKIFSNNENLPHITVWLRFILNVIIPRRDVKYEQCWRIYVFQFLNNICEFCKNRKFGDVDSKVESEALNIYNQSLVLGNSWNHIRVQQDLKKKVKFLQIFYLELDFLPCPGKIAQEIRSFSCFLFPVFLAFFFLGNRKFFDRFLSSFLKFFAFFQR